MTDSYRIYGAELSPYSVKVRSYFRYKQIPHEWLQRTPQNIAEYQKYAKLPLVPLVITPGTEPQGMQDSTPILEALEAQFPDPSIHPPDPAAAFLSALVEEYGDEWGNKWMFHYRWWREVDQISASERLAGGNRERAPQIRERMVDRLWFVGSSERTQEQIEESLQSALRCLEAQLEGRPYVFGARPAFADFGLAHQLHQARTDPTAGGIIERSAPRVDAWVHRMLDPKNEGPFEPLDALLPTLEPLLREEIGAVFLPWSAANARAIAEGAPEFEVELGGRTWAQRPQKYHAKSLGVLRARYSALADRAALDPILERTGCLPYLR